MKVEILADYGLSAAGRITDDEGQFLTFVTTYYCPYCAHTRNGASRDGTAPCAHMDALFEALHPEDADAHEDAAMYRELAAGL